MKPLDLLQETLDHFKEGAVSVRAHTNTVSYIITKGKESDEYLVTKDEPGYIKERTTDLHPYFKDVFGIEARY